MFSLRNKKIIFCYALLTKGLAYWYVKFCKILIICAKISQCYIVICVRMGLYSILLEKLDNVAFYYLILHTNCNTVTVHIINL